MLASTTLIALVRWKIDMLHIYFTLVRWMALWTMGCLFQPAIAIACQWLPGSNGLIIVSAMYGNNCH